MPQTAFFAGLCCAAIAAGMFLKMPQHASIFFDRMLGGASQWPQRTQLTIEFPNASDLVVSEDFIATHSALRGFRSRRVHCRGLAEPAHPFLDTLTALAGYPKNWHPRAQFFNVILERGAIKIDVRQLGLSNRETGPVAGPAEGQPAPAPGAHQPSRILAFRAALYPLAHDHAQDRGRLHRRHRPDHG